MITKYIVIFVFLADIAAVSQTWQILPSLPEAPVRYEDLWFINENTGWVIEAGDNIIYKTTNGGVSFVEQFRDSTGGYIRSVAFNNANLGWVGSLSGRLYRTTNGGTNWIRVDTSIIPAPVGVCDISVIGDQFMYGSGRYNGPTNIIKTTNGGLAYENIDMGAYSNYQVGVWFLNASTGFVGSRSSIITEGSVMLRTTDGGDSWSKVYRSFLQSEHVWNIWFINQQTGFATIERFIQGNGAVIKTTNGGLNWIRIEVPQTGTDLDPIAFKNENTGWIANHAGFSTQGIWQTTNGGFNWSNIPVGSSIHGLFAVNDSTAYASGDEVYKYTRGVVGISGNQNINIPQSNILKQNYPNPFNPETVISYELIMNTNVVVEIYNSAGEFVEKLMHGREGPGSFSVKWNASNYPSGVYFYSLRTDLGNYFGKAILVK